MPRQVRAVGPMRTRDTAHIIFGVALYSIMWWVVLYGVRGCYRSGGNVCLPRPHAQGPGGADTGRICP